MKRIKSYLKIFKSLSFPNALIGNPGEAMTRPPTKTFGGDSLRISFRCFIFLVLSIYFVYPFYAIAGNSTPVVDQDMARKMALLDSQYKKASAEKYECHFEISRKALPKTDLYSSFSPNEITVSYQNHQVFQLTEPGWLGQDDVIRRLEMQCLEANGYVYLFLDASAFNACQKFKLCDPSYAAMSKDRGETWSSLQSLKQLLSVEKDRDILPPPQAVILGDQQGHILEVSSNRVGGQIYLLDPQLKLLRKISKLELKSPLYFYNGRFYFIQEIPEQSAGKKVYSGLTYLWISNDYGRTWSKIKTPDYVKSAVFIFHRGGPYYAYHTPYQQSSRSFIPALEHKGGFLKVQKLNADGFDGQPKILSQTASDVLHAYEADSPIIIWQDRRFDRSKGCGFIPLIGCVDSEPFEDVKAVYAGELDMDTWQLKESLIEYKE